MVRNTTTVTADHDSDKLPSSDINANKSLVTIGYASYRFRYSIDELRNLARDELRNLARDQL